MKLLRYFVEHEGALLPRQRILDAVWGADYFGTDRTVDNFVNRLRGKLEPDPKTPSHIVTLRGAGYRFTRAPRTDGEGSARRQNGDMAETEPTRRVRMLLRTTSPTTGAPPIGERP